MASDDLNVALGLIRKNIEKAAVRIRELKRSANTLATAEGEPIVYSDADEPIETGGGSAAIRADLFAQYSTPSTAARAYLEHRGKTTGAATIEDIFDALKRGGYGFEGSDVDAKGSLRIALGKDAQVKRLPNGTYGIGAWYGERFAPKKEKAAAEQVAIVTEAPPPTPASVAKEGEPKKL